MAVIDRGQLFATVVHVAERAQLFARVYAVPGRWRLVDVRAADRACGLAGARRDEPAGLVRCGLARVGDDLVADRARQAQGLRYAPPAIAGMTMTSEPSGTLALVPPLLRASSSPMYTFT